MLLAERQLEAHGGDGESLDERNVYQHIIISCKNRIRLLANPKAQLCQHSMARGKYVKLVKQLKKKKDADSQTLFRFVRQGCPELGG